MEVKWERKLYETWDDAFKGLEPLIRQQSVRVAAYAQTLFTQACASSFASGTEAGAEQIQGMYVDLAYKCGLYHQLGKAVDPCETYTVNGRILVATLQERSVKARIKYQKEWKEPATRNIALLMLRDTCEQHMERFDGSGYPRGLVGNEISPIAQIVGLAKELDRLVSETKSEHPFEDAYQVLLAEADKGFAAELIEILKACRGKCRRIYNKYIQYTQTLPKTIPLVEKRKNRPMGLVYRPMIRDAAGSVYAYEAIPWFGGVLNNPKKTEKLQDVEALLHRTNLVEDVSMYLLYEAADAVLRIQNCKLPLEGIVVPMLEEFYTGGDRMNRMWQLYEEQPIDKRMLMLMVPQSVLMHADEQTMTFIAQLLDEGTPLILDDYRPGELPVEAVKKSGISMVRFEPELNMSPDTAMAMNVLTKHGFQIVGGQADDKGIVAWLQSCGVTYMSGEATGKLVTEDEIVHDMLLREQ